MYFEQLKHSQFFRIITNVEIGREQEMTVYSLLFTFFSLPMFLGVENTSETYGLTSHFELTPFHYIYQELIQTNSSSYYPACLFTGWETACVTSSTCRGYGDQISWPREEVLLALETAPYSKGRPFPSLVCLDWKRIPEIIKNR